MELPPQDSLPFVDHEVSVALSSCCALHCFHALKTCGMRTANRCLNTHAKCMKFCTSCFCLCLLFHLCVVVRVCVCLLYALCGVVCGLPLCVRTVGVSRHEAVRRRHGAGGTYSLFARPFFCVHASCVV